MYGFLRIRRKDLECRSDSLEDMESFKCRTADMEGVEGRLEIWKDFQCRTKMWKIQDQCCGSGAFLTLDLGSKKFGFGIQDIGTSRSWQGFITQI